MSEIFLHREQNLVKKSETKRDQKTTRPRVSKDLQRSGRNNLGFDSKAI